MQLSVIFREGQNISLILIYEEKGGKHIQYSGEETVESFCLIV